MVKHWIVMIVIAIVIVVACCVESSYMNRSFDWLINSVESLQIELTENKENINTEELKAKAYSIHENWHKRVKVLKCLIWHTGIKDVEVGLARICVYIVENDYTEALAESQSLIDYAAHYSDDFKISIENIF